jgi:hypothetical protein
MKKAITYIVFFVFAVLIGLAIGHCEDRKWEPIYSPVYNPAHSWVWNSAKLSGFLAGGMDVRSTVNALERGCSETSFVDNIFMDSRDPHPKGRHASNLIIQYGYNSLLDWAWRRATSKREKAILIGVRLGLTGLSVWAYRHNEGLRR